MSLKERGGYYYFTLKKSCAEGILLGASEVYGLGLTEADADLFAGFRTGMGCKSTCGSLIGAIAVLSRMYGQREDLKELCGRFVETFEKKLACGAIDCATLNARYKTDSGRCRAVVELTAEALEEFIDALEGRTAAPAGEGCTLRPEDIKRVKALGFLHHKGTNKFNGRITNEECQAIADAAKLYGDGHMMFTTRLTAEVSGIDYNDIDAFRAYVGQVGLETGGTGSKVRPVVSCKGTTCQYGLIDTLGLSEKIHERFYLGYHDVTLPHKFKIAVGGCPNNCVKPDLNDLGIIGQRVPAVEPDKCRGCKKCQIENNCPIKAAKVVDGKLVLGADCNDCGRCKGKCPFGAIPEYTDGYKVYIGGRWGKKFANGRPLEKIFTSEEEVMDVVERAILFFRDEGLTGERFADTIRRLGFDYVQDKLLNSRIDKTAVLNKTVKGGATC